MSYHDGTRKGAESQMQTTRRLFLKQFAGAISILLGGTQLVGCLGKSDTQQPGMQSGSAAAAQPIDQAAPQPTAPAAPPQMAANAAPMWQPSPTVDFVEGVPTVVSIRSFVNDADGGQLLITLNSGMLPPGITWNPNNATLAYDGRPLGAKPEAPVVLTDVTFAADDQQN
jgi:hypothetical protein